MILYDAEKAHFRDFFVRMTQASESTIESQAILACRAQLFEAWLRYACYSKVSKPKEDMHSPSFEKRMREMVEMANDKIG